MSGQVLWGEKSREGPLRLLAVGDPFVPEDIFREALAELEGVEVQTAQVDAYLPEPGADGAPVSEYVGSPEAVRALMQDLDVLLVHVAPVTAAVLDSAPSLRAVGCARGGPLNVDVEAATERGIAVLRAPGRNAEAVAELTIWLMLSLARNTGAALSAAAGAGLGASVIEGAPFLGRELAGRTLGIVGYGRVGCRVAELARAFGMTVVVYDPYVPAAEIEAAGSVPLELERLLARADVVSLHLRAAPETEDMFGSPQFAAMRPDSLFINAARETLVDEAALLDALESGQIAGAGLDVIRARADGSRSPLLGRPDVVILPHVGGATREAGLNGVRILVDAVRRLLAGEDAGELTVNSSVLSRRASDAAQ
jgi:D-3-phosphoglycerate dehydrogenase / 2-oxoglutarate reductase